SRDAEDRHPRHSQRRKRLQREPRLVCRHPQFFFEHLERHIVGGEAEGDLTRDELLRRDLHDLVTPRWAGLLPEVQEAAVESAAQRLDSHKRPNRAGFSAHLGITTLSSTMSPPTISRPDQLESYGSDSKEKRVSWPRSSVPS